MDMIPTLELVLGIALGVVLAAGQVIELYNLLSPVFHPLLASKSSSKTFAQIVRDFRKRKFYKPWGRAEPVIIRNPDQMQELSEASELSQRAIYADIFGFKYNMTHTEIDMDPNEQTAARYRLFARAIKIIGLSQIASLQPYLQAKLEKTVSAAMHSRTEVDGWVTMELAPLMRDAASGMLGVYLFGSNLTEEPEFSSAMLRYYQDVIKCMGILQLLPDFLKSTAHAIITRNGRALNVLFARLNRVLQFPRKEWDEDDHLKSMTLLHNLIEVSKESSYWTDTGLIQAIIGIWFGVSHQPWINLHFVFLELCSRPEYVKMIREEIDRQETLDYNGLSKLPILDSFIKESVRVNPLDKMSIRRKALKPYKFSNGGPFVAVGEIACVSGWDIMHDETKYPEADEFDGLRFLKQSNSQRPQMVSDTMRGTVFTDASTDFPIWGLGSKVCPGRWHGALVIKMTIVHLLSNYDFRLKDAGAPQRWWWESFQMPYYSTKVSFRKRD